MLELATSAHHGWSVSSVEIYAALTVALITILGFVYRVARRIEDAVGKDDQGRTLNQRMDRVEHQLWPNGGSSLADKVNNIGDAQITAAAEQRVVRDLMTKVIESRIEKS